MSETDAVLVDRDGLRFPRRLIADRFSDLYRPSAT
jgi:hypothetical protein